jgi:radical SAM superfamily enzyme with C-terminal helix-hairpin-helix motif
LFFASFRRSETSSGLTIGSQPRESAHETPIVRYKTKPETAQENERLIQQVFQELQAKSPQGVRYLALKLGDGTFIHFSTVEAEDEASPIPQLEAFRSFQSGIKERCVEPPQSSAVTIVGNYRTLGET